MTKIKLTINGKEVWCEEGEKLIDVAKRVGNYIPRFCYHPSLSVVASCRMCMVDIEGFNKSQPACATKVSEGMVVSTQSKKVIDDQKSMMQFLLVNHPLHCPICDQGGECDLQDTAMGYGLGYTDMPMTKRTVKDEDLGPLIATEMSLCIHCTRCVRFGKEISGIPDLGMVGRGDSSEISTYLQKGIRSELSGNMIDLCPVGALTSKPFKNKGRAWGFRQHFGVSLHDCLGSNLYYHTLPKGYDHLSDVMRVVPKSNPVLNDIWLSDRDRFSYEAIQTSARLMSPKIKRNNIWIDVSWQEAMSVVINKLNELSATEKEKAGVWLSSLATMEEGFLAQALFRGLGIQNIDYRVTEYTDNTEMFLEPSEVNLHDFKTYDVIVLLGCNIRYEQSLMSYQIFEAVKNGTEVLSLGAIKHEYPYKHEYILTPSQKLASRLFTLLQSKNDGGHEWMNRSKVLFILGEEALTHPKAHEMKHILYAHCKDKEHDYLYLTKGPNALGLKAVGCLPDKGPFFSSVRAGMDYQSMVNTDMSFMLLHQLDPSFDLADGKKAISMLSKAFVVSLASYDTWGVREASDVILPVSLPAETAGSYVNYLGMAQAFEAAIRPAGDIRPGWAIYGLLSSLLEQESWDYEKLKKHISMQYRVIKWPKIDVAKPTKPKDLEAKWMKLGLSSWVRGDSQIRHAKALQQAYPKDTKMKVSSQANISLPNLEVSENIANNVLVFEKSCVHYESVESLS